VKHLKVKPEADILMILWYFQPYLKYLSIFRVFTVFFSINAVIKVEKMHTGCRFLVWVSFHTTILKSWKFQENRRRQVKVLSPVNHSCNKFPSNNKWILSKQRYTFVVIQQQASLTCAPLNANIFNILGIKCNVYDPQECNTLFASLSANIYCRTYWLLTTYYPVGGECTL